MFSVPVCGMNLSIDLSIVHFNVVVHDKRCVFVWCLISEYCECTLVQNLLNVCLDGKHEAFDYSLEQLCVICFKMNLHIVTLTHVCHSSLNICFPS